MEKAIVVRRGAVLGFAVGLLLLLMQTHTSGEAPQTFKLLMEPGALVMIGGGLMGVSLSVFTFSLLKNSTKDNKV